MKNSADCIQVTHAGSLPRTSELIQAARQQEQGDPAAFAALAGPAVGDVVRLQREVGITSPNDGEYGKAMSASKDYGTWWSYAFPRLSGLEVAEANGVYEDRHLSEPGHIQLTGFAYRRDRQAFAEAYADPESGIFTGRPDRVFPRVVGPLRYVGQEAVAADIAHLQAALKANGFEEGFLTSVSPSSLSRIGNQYYTDEHEYLWACADAMHEEYRAITDAGLIVQVDDPSIAENFDQIEPEPSVEDYLAFTRERVEALNYALRGIPEEQVRFHLCWGSWHGPHTTDFEFKNLVDLMLEIHAGAYSFEAANVRHEHEWTVWEDAKLPEGKLILPGVVTHSTNVVEHPELVAQRIERFASLVGRENVVASTDCGMGGRIHPQIAWAKLRALGEGARLATARLY
jgi:5-methyltetrahydropteroyltriglutamate--homocysteine methyltransferase